MTDRDVPWLVGCGSADITGEPWNAGMLGYGMRFQRTTGIHLRQRSRAFVIGHPATGRRLAFVVADIGMFFANVRDAVLARLDPTVLRPQDVLLTATHTHAGAGGFSGYRMYNLNDRGLRQHTFAALVDGVVASLEQALADLAPGRLVLSQGRLHDASVNRSPEAFTRNPERDRRHFPTAIDPMTTVLRMEREGRMVGAVNWFATHGTSLTNRNTLLSGDNKGYAAQAWEELLADGPRRPVTAFAQTNAGDMSPNLPDARQGPTGDEVENTRLIGERQLTAARVLASEPGTELRGDLDAQLSYLDLPGLHVGAGFTPDGRRHRLGGAVLGAAFAAGTKEGRGVGFCHEGVDANPVLAACSGLVFRVRPKVGDAQSPKAMLLPVGALGWVAGRVPLQLVRIGQLVLVGLAQEVTIVAGLRIRRAVAEVLDLPLDRVLVQGYANDYAGYVTTPEEYDAQRYEGGHTMYGRWLLPAYLQEATRVAADLRDGRQSASARPPRARPPAPAPQDAADPHARCHGVRTQPPEVCAPGDVVVAEFAGDDPRGRARSRYLLVQRHDRSWRTVADDADWSTTVRWRRHNDATWIATVTWRVPSAAAGLHRVTYLDRDETRHPTSSFEVRAGAERH